MADEDAPVLKKSLGTSISWASGKDPTKKVPGGSAREAGVAWVHDHSVSTSSVKPRPRYL